jgi:uncharacterized membrane protein
MITWMILVFVSLAIGAAIGIKRCSNPIMWGAAIPWFGFLALLIVDQYWLSKNSSPLWFLAQIFGGTVAAILGVLSALITSKIIKSRPKDDRTKPKGLGRV